MFPVFGKRVYTEILPLEWMEFLRGMEQKGIIEQMGRVRAFCKEIYDLARVTGRAVHNPLKGSANSCNHVALKTMHTFRLKNCLRYFERSTPTPTQRTFV